MNGQNIKLTEATKEYVTRVIRYVQEEKKDKDIMTRKRSQSISGRKLSSGDQPE